MLDAVGAFLESVHAHKSINFNNNLQVQVNAFFTQFLKIKTAYENDQTSLINFTSEKRSDNLNEDQTEKYFLTMDRVNFIFHNLRGKLSSGIDKIPNIILKNVPEDIRVEYCKLFNNMLNNSYFPYKWKEAKVILLPKKGRDSSNPKNLRPISLLPNISKIFEICINNNINKHCLDNNLFCEKQFGFKHNHSTVNAINFLLSNINWNLNREFCTGACLIDMEKAFDSVWIPGLIFQLNEYKFPMYQIILIYNMISNKSFKVHHENNVSSRIFSITNGLQQGTVNSPILFNLYILKLLDKIEDIISFADDIIIYHADDTIEKINKFLQEKFSIVEKFTSDWNMNINIQKCETILFRPPVNKCNYNIRKNWKQFGIKSSLNNTSIPNKEVVKYLGIYLDKFLYFNIHINEILIKAKQAFFSYKSLFYSKFIKPRVKILMYQTLIRPIITYGCAIWFNISPSYMEKLRLFERKCLRACTSKFSSSESNYKHFISNKKLYRCSNIIRIDNFIIYLIRNHIRRCISTFDNNLIMAPYYTNEEYIINTVEKGFVPPEAFLLLDKMNIIQNGNCIPIFYHKFRRSNIKAVNLNSVADDVRFNADVGNKKPCILQRLKTEIFWWLNP